MEYRKLRLAPYAQHGYKLKSARITVMGYIGEFNALGRAALAKVCKAWALPVTLPAALQLYTQEGAPEYTLCAVPAMELDDSSVPVTTNADATKVRVDLFHYMNAIDLHLGRRTKWVIQLTVEPGVDQKPCLFLDTQTDLAEIRQRRA